MGKVSLVSLGCPKNLVDSENLLKRLREEGISYSSNDDESDAILVNTCGFIEDAKRESIEEILRLAELKKKKKIRKLIVFGCLAKRYKKVLQEDIPEIDAIWGLGEEGDIVKYCKEVLGKSSLQVKDDKFSDTPYAYLKIAEGCDRKCTYCIIPAIRGKYLSRDPQVIYDEAKSFLESGKKELILIAQDITSYGKNFKGYNLSRLIKDIASIKGDFWIRLLYLYPASISDELIETIRSEQKVCKYIDMPLQHSEKKILTLMGRGGNSRYFEKLISKMRDIIPDVNIRTTFITGFPNETNRDFKRLLEFVRKIKFERLGVFLFSKEEGTHSFKMKGQVAKYLKRERHNKIMEIQSEISLEINKGLIGRTYRALIDEVDNNMAVARLYSQAPDIDGVVILNNTKVKKGAFVNVKIEEAYDYDLKGSVLE